MERKMDILEPAIFCSWCIQRRPNNSRIAAISDGLKKMTSIKLRSGTEDHVKTTYKCDDTIVKQFV